MADLALRRPQFVDRIGEHGSPSPAGAAAIDEAAARHASVALERSGLGRLAAIPAAPVPVAGASAA